MKLLKYTFLSIACALLINCSNDDDDTTEDLTGQKGDVLLKFDNGVGDLDFTFNTTFNRSNGETFNLNTLKYIISDVKLKDSNGNVFTYPAEDNIFIIDEADANNAGEIWITLNNVDAANYTEVTFGIGVSQARFLLGAEGQGDFLEEAQSEGMMWAWATGYKFVRMDGTFTTNTVTDGALNIHMGSVGTSLDNYKEVTLALPNTILVRENKTPQIHFLADISKVFDNPTTVSFDDGYNQVHTSAETTPVIANNMATMFSVDHVHNN